MSLVRCQVSSVSCQLSCVRCTFFLSIFRTKWQSYSVEGLLSTGPTRLGIYGLKVFFMVIGVFLFCYWIACSSAVLATLAAEFQHVANEATLRFPVYMAVSTISCCMSPAPCSLLPHCCLVQIYSSVPGSWIALHWVRIGKPGLGSLKLWCETMVSGDSVWSHEPWAMRET